MKKESETPMIRCIRKGINIYPVYFRGSWYLEVSNNGKKRRGKKVVSTGKTMGGKMLVEALEVAYTYYDDKLNKNHKNE